MPDVALVCGGSGALGAAVVDAFVARGDRVVSAARRPPAAEHDRVRHETVDLTDADAVEALWERLAGDGVLPRWLVNAVGGFRGGTVAMTEQEDYRFLQQLNLDATWWSCRAAARRLPEGAAIVNVAARPALVGGAGSSAYAVSKAAVLRLTQVLSDELRERRVRVNAVLPSVMDTQGNRAVISAERMRESVSTDDVAAVISFLCSEHAWTVSGAAIPVYGWA
jgi:NAD(P)-dependent dehydrogenase (short-subunit alcohol dehydrogenase family)